MSPLLAAALLSGLVAQPQRSVLQDLQALDRELVEAEEKLLTLESQLQQLEQSVASMETEVAATRVRAAEAFDLFRRRVRALAKMPTGARLVLLGGARSLADFLEASRVLRWVAEHDRRLQRSYVDEVSKLEALETRLAAQRDLHKLTVAEARATRDTIAADRQERLHLLASVAERGELQSLTAREQRAARKQLASMVENLAPRVALAARFADNRGVLPWPVSGKVDVRFGQRVEHTYGTVTSHNGWDIRAPAGTPVQAIAGGRVVFADWLQGYGQLVIVDHGEHYHTLAAHLATIAAAKGDEVEQGTIIGTVGDTGSLRGTLLYFEIRERGAPIDPRAWLRR